MKKITTLFMLLFATVCFAQFPYLQGKLLIGQELKFFSEERLKNETGQHYFTGIYSDEKCYHIYKELTPGNRFNSKAEALAGRTFVIKDVIIKKNIAQKVVNVLVINSGDETIYVKVNLEDKIAFDLPNFKITDPAYWDGYIKESVSVIKDRDFNANWDYNFNLSKSIREITKKTEYSISLYTRQPFKECTKFKLILEDGTVIPLNGLVTKFMDVYASIGSSLVDEKYMIQLSKSPIKFIDYGDLQSPYERAEEVKNIIARLLLKS